MSGDEFSRYQLLAQINNAFTPSAPIDSRDLFAGRSRQVDKLISTISQKGSHAILFGERGVGKTSLANTIFDFLVLAGESRYVRAKLNCADGMSFEDMWRTIFKQFVVTQTDGTSATLDEILPSNPNSENIRETFQLFDDPSIVIIDELDRVVDGNIKTLLADTIKTLSDNAIRTTLILVGVADSVDKLIGEHLSIERAIKQVPMPRMSKGELIQIIENGLGKCAGLAINEKVKARIADYSQGLPSFTHLLSREAALVTVGKGSNLILMEDLDAAIKEAVDSQLATNLTAYTNAVSAQRGKYFRPVLLACALAMKDEKGYFFAKNVEQPLKLIAGKEMGIAAFAQHLNDFSTDRGPILEREGRRYRFIRPIMVPYVILRGLADGLISESQLSHPEVNFDEPEQLSLLSGFEGSTLDC